MWLTYMKFLLNSKQIIMFKFKYINNAVSFKSKCYCEVFDVLIAY